MKLSNSKTMLSFLWLVCFIAVSTAIHADGIDELKESISKAGQLLKTGKISESSKLIEQATLQLQELVLVTPDRQISELKKLHSQLLRAHALLSVEGADLPDLQDWDSLLKAKKTPARTVVPPAKTVPPANAAETNTTKPASATDVSFSNDIAPWMLEQCSRCHINAERGGFSLATYNALMKGSKGGTVVFPGDPVASRLVESIETGDMPRNGSPVSPENLAKLKRWVKDGAKFDGPPDATATPIAVLVRSPKTIPKSPEKAEAPVPSKPSGKETVSFSRDIAPILISSCNGCHYNGTRQFGGLQFNSFAGLLKGGQSGEAFTPGKPDESLLVRKLLGTSGARMPMDRPPLTEEQTMLISTWIKEGATFDGQNQDSKLDEIANESWATRASHRELMERRMASAREKWKLVAPKRQADEASDEQLFVLGDIGSENANALLIQANKAVAQIRKMFKLQGKEPLIKGGITIFALKQRYDYSEFGTMLESRSLPPEWSSHWRSGSLDAYVAMVFDKSEDKINESSLVQQIVSLWIGSCEGVPKWFADGAGRQSLAVAAGINDARVQPWIKRLPESVAQLRNLKPFIEGSMNDEDSATIGFGVIRFIHESKMKNQYEMIIRSLASGKNWEQATSGPIGNVELFLQKVLRKSK